MLGKWLTRAKEWLKPFFGAGSGSGQPPQKVETEEPKPSRPAGDPPPERTGAAVHHAPEPVPKVSPAEAAAGEEKTAAETAQPAVSAAESPSTQVPETEAAAVPRREMRTDDTDWFRFEEGGFRFSIPLEPEEREVLDAADARYEEAKNQAFEGGAPRGPHSLEHQRAMKYWSLQIFYRDRAQECYKRRSEDPEALDRTIRYCEKQIRYAPMAIHANRMDPQSKGLPQHYGYKQLAIIHDKEGEPAKAIQLCKQARDEGWKGDWTARIGRYEKRRA